MSVNKAILVGRLGRDPEIRYTSAGKAVANFSLATDETWTDASGNRQKKTEWHRITAWDNLAEVVQKYTTKGSLIYVEGRIQSRVFDDKQTGQKRTSFEIVAQNIRLLGGNDRPGARITPSSTPAERDQAESNELYQSVLASTASDAEESRTAFDGGAEIDDNDPPF